jgi:putative glutamine amidotransferase
LADGGAWRDIDGVVLGGGANLAPALYGQELRVESAIDPERDALELDMLAMASARGLPVLGICRGAQLLNVRRGGTLHQQLKDHYPDHQERVQVLAKKSITVVARTRLADIGGRATLRVNSLHRQGVDQVGRGLVVSARDDLGIVQAIEDPDAPFVIGVQWHPEYMPLKSSQRRLFRALVAAARAHRERAEVTTRRRSTESPRTESAHGARDAAAPFL